MSERHSAVEPTTEEVGRIPGPALVEFGSPWCGHCMAAQPLIAAALERHPGVRHLKIEDGRGRRLGRSFRVKLWPTLVFLSDGKELERLVRPHDPDVIGDALARIDAAGPA